MKVFITGSSGFIATHLANSLRIKGYIVHGGSSQSAITHSACDTLIPLSLGSPLPETHEQYDWIIHCAYDKQQSVEINTSSTIMWADEFLQRGITQQIFISTIGVLTENSSEYVVAKKRTEEWFLQNNMVVVRPGLVIGDGGIFQEMVKKIDQFPIIPLIDGGQQKIKTIGLNDLLGEISDIIDGSCLMKEMNLFYPNEPIMKEIMIAIARGIGKKRFFLNIPYPLIYGIVKTLEFLGLKLSITSANIQGLKSNTQNLPSDYKKIKEITPVIIENLKGTK